MTCCCQPQLCGNSSTIAALRARCICRQLWCVCLCGHLCYSARVTNRLSTRSINLRIDFSLGPASLASLSDVKERQRTRCQFMWDDWALKQGILLLSRSEVRKDFAGRVGSGARRVRRWSPARGQKTADFKSVSTTVTFCNGALRSLCCRRQLTHSISRLPSEVLYIVFQHVSHDSKAVVLDLRTISCTVLAIQPAAGGFGGLSSY